MYIISQRQPPEVFCKKRCYKKFGKFHTKTPVLEFVFNKVLLWSIRFIVKFSKISRTPILKNKWEQLHLSTSEKIRPLLVLRKAVLDVRRHNWADKCLLLKHEPHVIVCAIFTLFLSPRNKPSRKYPLHRHISLFSPLTSILAHISPLKKAIEKCKPVSLFSRFCSTLF